MATSGSTDFSLNRDNVIKDAILSVSGVESGEDPTAAEVTDAARMLNMLIKYWNTYEIPLWARKTTTHTLVANTGSYTIGIGQTINVPAPMKILQAFSQLNGHDTPVEIISDKEYQMLGNKTSTGRETQLYYDKQRTTGTIHLYPVPSQATQLHLIYTRPFEDFDGATDEPDVPQEFYLPLVFGLAALLAPQYGVDVEEASALWKRAEDLLENGLGYNREDSVQIVPRLNG